MAECPCCHAKHCGHVCDCDQGELWEGFGWKARPHGRCCDCGECFPLIRAKRTAEELDEVIEMIRNS